MNKNRELASNIIDKIEDVILEQHPEIKELVKGYKGNTLLYGSKYYELEDYIEELIKNA